MSATLLFRHDLDSINLDKNNVVTFDLETTGLQPEDTQNTRIVQYSIVEEYDGVLNDTTRLVNPGIPIPPDVSAIHGIYDQMVYNAMPHGAAIDDILEKITNAWNKGVVVSGFNISFDLSIVYSQAHAQGKTLPPIGPLFDPMVVDRAVDKFRRGSRKLQAVAKHYGMLVENPHNAYSDAITTHMLTKYFIYHMDNPSVTMTKNAKQWLIFQIEQTKEQKRHFAQFKGLKNVDDGWPILNAVKNNLR